MPVPGPGRRARRRALATITSLGLVLGAAGVPTASGGPDASATSPGPGAATSPTVGYWLLTEDGSVLAVGDAAELPATGGRSVAASRAALARAVDLEAVPLSLGGPRAYVILWDDGALTLTGGLTAWPSPAGATSALGALDAGERAVSISARPNGQGWWIATDRGRVLAFGDAPAYGDLGAIPLNGPVLDSVASPSGRGYHLVAADGGVFAFGDAPFLGSMGGRPLNAPVTALVPYPDGTGYWLVATDGGVFSFARPGAPDRFLGSVPGVLAPGQRLNAPIAGMTPVEDGYVMVGEDGGLFAFRAPYLGSFGANRPAARVVAVLPRAGGDTRPPVAPPPTTQPPTTPPPTTQPPTTQPPGGGTGLVLDPGVYDVVGLASLRWYAAAPPAGTRCGWRRTFGTGIVERFWTEGPQVVDLTTSDATFEVIGCAFTDVAPPPVTGTPLAEPLGTGVHVIATAGIAGRWVSAGDPSGPCTYRLLASFLGTETAPATGLVATRTATGQMVLDLDPAIAAGLALEGAGCRFGRAVPATPLPTVAEGTWFVGTQVVPGRWFGTGTGCTVQRLASFLGRVADRRSSVFGSAPLIVDVDPGDAGLQVSGPCVFGRTAPGGPPATTAGEGDYLAGTTLAAGRWYRAGGRPEDPAYCRVERLRGFGGTADDLLGAQESYGPLVIDVAAGEGVRVRGADCVVSRTRPAAPPPGPLGEGTWLAAAGGATPEATAGLWRTGLGACTLRRLRSFTGTAADVIATTATAGFVSIRLEPGDAALEVAGSGCTAARLSA
jgi:hypothetical protein